MIISVYDSEWFNPEQVIYLRQEETATVIFFFGDDALHQKCVRVEGLKTAGVAKEINRQIRIGNSV